MKYESDILEMIHENATTNFNLGFISESKMREYDELCLAPETLQDNTSQGNIAHELVSACHNRR
jgi:DNA-binding transcriptional regulator YiaG